MWFLEKKELTDEIKELEGKLAASEAVNADLRNKNNMLEHCLRQIKAKNQSDKDLVEKEPEIPIPQRRPISNKSHISKYLANYSESSAPWESLTCSKISTGNSKPKPLPKI